MKSCHVKEKFLFFSLLQARTKHAKTLHWDFIGSIDGCAAFDARLLLRLSPAPICLLMTLFSSICCSRRDARFFCCLFFSGSTNSDEEFWVSGNHPAHTNDSSWFSITSQLLLEAPTLCFEIMQNDASRSVFLRSGISFRLAEVWHDNRIKF